MSQSKLLSVRQKTMIQSGKHFTDDSKISENILNLSINKLKEYFIPYVKEYFGTDSDIIIEKKMSVYDLMKLQKDIFPDFPGPQESYKKKFIRPDGGIWFLKYKNKNYPLLVIEDKKQGTNDIRYKEGNKKQALGNAVERFAKNVRACEMLFQSEDIFPYVMFASGCDFHSSESISERILSANYGFPNYVVELTTQTQPEEIELVVQNSLENMNIHKKRNLCVMQSFIKTHKYNELSHGASDWTCDERYNICSTILKLSISYYLQKLVSE